MKKIKRSKEDIARRQKSDTEGFVQANAKALGRSGKKRKGSK